MHLLQERRAPVKRTKRAPWAPIALARVALLALGSVHHKVPGVDPVRRAFVGARSSIGAIMLVCLLLARLAAVVHADGARGVDVAAVGGAACLPLVVLLHAAWLTLMFGLVSS